MHLAATSYIFHLHSFIKEIFHTYIHFGICYLSFSDIISCKTFCSFVNGWIKIAENIMYKSSIKEKYILVNMNVIMIWNADDHSWGRC